MVSAVSFIHSLGICHRDLKLENWVLARSNAWSDIKLIDFGLSTHFAPGEYLTRVVGSAYYVSPQVLSRRYTSKCDLWSLGVIAYMLLSGAPPFYGPNDKEIRAMITRVGVKGGEVDFPKVRKKKKKKTAKVYNKCVMYRRNVQCNAPLMLTLAHTHSTRLGSTRLVRRICSRTSARRGRVLSSGCCAPARRRGPARTSARRTSG